MPVMQIMDHRGETKALQEAKSEDPDNAEKEEAESQGSHLMDDLSTEGKKSPGMIHEESIIYLILGN